MTVVAAVGGAGGTRLRNTRVRLASLVLAALFAACTLLLVQEKADAAVSAPVAAAIAAPDGISAQINIDISAIVCPILLAVRDAFANTFLGGFITPILNQFLVLFGCVASG